MSLRACQHGEQGAGALHGFRCRSRTYRLARFVIADFRQRDDTRRARRSGESLTQVLHAFSPRTSPQGGIIMNLLTTTDLTLPCSFRRGLNSPRISLPMCVVRACIRVGKPRRALYFAMQKVRVIFAYVWSLDIRGRDGRGGGGNANAVICC